MSEQEKVMNEEIQTEDIEKTAEKAVETENGVASENEAAGGESEIENGANETQETADEAAGSKEEKKKGFFHNLPGHQMTRNSIHTDFINKKFQKKIAVFRFNISNFTF